MGEDKKNTWGEGREDEMREKEEKKKRREGKVEEVGGRRR